MNDEFVRVIEEGSEEYELAAARHEECLKEAVSALSSERDAWFLSGEDEDSDGCVAIHVESSGGAAAFPDSLRRAMADGVLCAIGSLNDLREQIFRGVTPPSVDGSPDVVVYTVVGENVMAWPLTLASRSVLG